MKTTLIIDFVGRLVCMCVVAMPLCVASEQAALAEARPMMTEERQSVLTPQEVKTRLIAGNREYVQGKLMPHNTPQRVAQASGAQYPKAVIISCMDSRVPVEDVFQQAIGDVFVLRVAGNVVNDDMLASMEYATRVSGAKLVVVLGHEGCGAIKAAVKGADLGHIPALLSKIEPAVVRTEKELEIEREAGSKLPAFVERVCRHNVRLAKEQVRERSAVLRQMEEAGEIGILGAVYLMNTGEVVFM